VTLSKPKPHGKVGTLIEDPTLAFAFAPAGLLFPYYIGVAYQLRDLGLLNSSTPLGGSSAGAIVAAAVACGCEEHGVVASLAKLLEDVRNGEKLKSTLRRQLEDMLPEDAVLRAERHGLTIAYLEVLPRPRPHMVTSWESREDLIDTILASCNYPLFFSRWPLVKCRGAWAVDGLFSIERPRYGCPPLPGDRAVAIVALKQKTTIFNTSDIIQPGQDGMDLPDDVSETQWDWWTAIAAPDEKIQTMIALGRDHARTWAVKQWPALTASQHGRSGAKVNRKPGLRQEAPPGTPLRPERPPTIQQTPRVRPLPRVAWSGCGPFRIPVPVLLVLPSADGTRIVGGLFLTASAVACATLRLVRRGQLRRGRGAVGDAHSHANRHPLLAA
jgi:hypothetical protein